MSVPMEKRGEVLFASARPDSDQRVVMDELARQYADLHNYIIDNVKKGRLRSIALTDLELSSMWANKAVCHDGLTGG